MTRLIVAVATGFYVGLLPKRPALWGSVAAFLPWLLIRDLPLAHYLATLSLFFIAGFFAAGSAEKILDRPDADAIVIDEMLGMLVALTAAPPHPAAWLAALVLFRLFTRIRLFPIGWIKDHIHGGIGIMGDDVIAGIYTWLALHILCRLAGLG